MAATSYINLNGKLISAPDASVPYNNRAFRYGYGLFETMLLRNAEIQLKTYHWQRLFSGMQQLYFELPKLFTNAFLETEVIKTVAKNKLDNLCRIRLQVFADEGGLYDGYSKKPQFIIECFPLQEHIAELNEHGLTLGIAKGLQKSIDSLANLKSSNALIYAMAAQQAKTNKWNDALVENTQGNIIESTIANLFWVKNKIIYTPPLTEGCIAGVMRTHLFSALPAKGYNLIEKACTITDIDQADNIFLTNAVRGIKWVGAVGDKGYTPGLAQSISRDIFP